MLQTRFRNNSSVPMWYSTDMTNQYDDGCGYFGMTYTNNYIGWESYKSGEGYYREGLSSYNHNLIFQI